LGCSSQHLIVLRCDRPNRPGLTQVSSMSGLSSHADLGRRICVLGAQLRCPTQSSPQKRFGQPGSDAIPPTSSPSLSP
jgi:hypothetical protein